jgi:hypothetical protein
MIFNDFLLKDKILFESIWLSRKAEGRIYFCASFFPASWSFKAAHQSAAHKNSLFIEAI